MFGNKELLTELNFHCIAKKMQMWWCEHLHRWNGRFWSFRSRAYPFLPCKRFLFLAWQGEVAMRMLRSIMSYEYLCKRARCKFICNLSAPTRKERWSRLVALLPVSTLVNYETLSLAFCLFYPGKTHYKFSLFLANNQHFASRRLRRLTQNLRVASPSLPSGRYTRVYDACSA